jgi:hypothetical protein
MADTNPSGMGLASMTERATELGGWCTNQQSPTGGTWIKAWLPILTEGSAQNAEPPATAGPGRNSGRPVWAQQRHQQVVDDPDHEFLVHR